MAPLVITRIFNAPRERVFQAWIDPKHLAQWWGPHGFTNPVCEVDARPGGAILIHMTDDNDGTVYLTNGIFQEIIPPERLVFTISSFPDDAGNDQLEILNTVIFEDANTNQTQQTKMTFRAEVLKSTPEMAVPLSGMEEGWTESLDRLVALLNQLGG